MAASRSNPQTFESSLVVECAESRFQVGPDCVMLRRNGLEFKSPASFALWTEMTIALEGEQGSKPFEGRGVVVACEGNRHQGFMVSVLFVEMAPELDLSLRSFNRPALS